MAAGVGAQALLGSVGVSRAPLSESRVELVRRSGRDVYDDSPGMRSGDIRRFALVVSVAEPTPASVSGSATTSRKSRRRLGSKQMKRGQGIPVRDIKENFHWHLDSGASTKTQVKAAVGLFVDAEQDVPPSVVDHKYSLDVIRETLNSMLESSSELLQSTQLAQGPACGVPSPTENENVDPLSVAESSSEGRRSVERIEFPGEKDELWLRIREEAREDSEAEPALASFLYSTILAHRSLERALAFHIGNKLSSSTLLSTQLFTLISDTLLEDASIREAIRADIMAVKDRDPACISYSHCILNFKGFQALQAHRVSHRLWMQGRYSLALALQSRVSEVFHVDFHPAAKIGKGVLFDHATGVVVGETATIGDNVSILHHVTLGGTGALGGDRHPKVEDGVLIGAGATILGPITIGEGAKIGAGSVVLMDIPAHCTAVGNPARLVGGKEHPTRLTEIPSKSMDHTIGEWADYVI